MRWPLRNQIMYPLLAVTGCSIVAVGAINAWLTERRTSQLVEDQIRGVSRVLTTSNFPLTDGVLRQMRDLSGAEFVLHDETGRTTASTLATSERLPDATAVARIEDVSLGPTASIAGRSYFHTIVKIPSTPGRGRQLHVLFPRDEYRRAWRQAFIPSLIVGVATLAAVAAVAHVLSKRIGRTTTHLGKEVARLALGDFRSVEVPKVDDEFRDLSLAVNRTAEKLADYEAQVRRSEQLRTVSMLGASIAHQVRNSVTGCRIAIDLHREECDSGADQESLEVAQRQLKLIESQLQRFLQIGQQQVQHSAQDIDLAQLVEGTLPLVRPAAQHAGIDLQYKLTAEPLCIRGDEEAMQQVVLNLLLNAIEAAQHNGIKQRNEPRVCIEIGKLTNNANAAEIVIRDSGAGPADGVAVSLFEPFVTDKPEGAGLGLAVVKDVIAAHDGTITWSRNNNMTQFRVTLPLQLNQHADVTNTHC